MNNNFYEMIFKRKSFHIFRNIADEPINEDELNDIQKAYSEFTPLNPEIKTAIRIRGCSDRPGAGEALGRFKGCD